MSPNFNHILAYEQLVLGSVTTAILADSSVTSQKISITGNLNFNEYQALQLRLENVSTNPSPGNAGRLIWNTSLQEVLVDTGSVFEPISTVSAVTSIHADSNPDLTGDVQFVSGTNVILSQTGQAITISVPTAGLNYSNFIVGEDLTSQVGGTVFTLANTPHVNTDALYVNGIRQRRGVGFDYTISGAVVTFTYTPETGSIVLADYLK